MNRKEIEHILVEKYGCDFEDVHKRTWNDLRRMFSRFKKTESDEAILPDDEADLYPNGRDFDAEDEDC